MSDNQNDAFESERPLDFKRLKKSVINSADPVVEAIQKYEPYKGKGRYKVQNRDEMPEMLASFFTSTADAIEAQQRNTPLDQASEVFKQGGLKQTAKSLTDQGSSLLDQAGKTAKNGKLDKKAQKLQKQLEHDLKKAKLDQKGSDFLSNIGSNVGGSIKDAKLDQKAGEVVSNISGSIKDAKLDQRANDAVSAAGDVVSNVGDAVSGFIKDNKLDKKTGDVVSNIGDSIKEAKLDKKAGDVFSNIGDTFKEAKLGEKAGDLVSNIGGAVKDAKLDKKAGDVVSNIGDSIKEAKLDQRAGDVVSNVGDAVSGFIKDNKLDKKAGDLVDTVAGFAAPMVAVVSDLTEKASDSFKDNKLDQKASNLVSNLGDSVKDAKLDQKLADAQLPEKLFAAANSIPGVEIKNPKKVAKQFRKQRKAVLKVVGKQQKELNKLYKQRRYQAEKYIQATQQDIKSGKTRISGYEPSKQNKGFPWLRTVLLGGLAYGGLVVNNNRIWSNVPPLQSKLTGDGKYYRSRQGVIFYKEAGETKEGQAPVVFVQGIGAGNTGYEWIGNFEAAAANHKVYAFDMLGFGNSERPDLKYTAEVYIKQLTEFLDEVVKQPAVVIASSLSSSYAVQVAFRRPQLIQKLVLMEPSGIFRKAGDMGPNLVGPLSGVAYSLLRAPIIGKAIYGSIASHSGIKSFMESQMFYNKALATTERVEQYWIASHQEGADFAPPSFFTGLLNAEIGVTLGKIEQPLLIIWGKQSRITPEAERKALSTVNKQAQVETLDRAMLQVNQDQPDEFNRLVETFLGQPGHAEAQTTGQTVGFTHDQTNAPAPDLGNAQTTEQPGQTEFRATEFSDEPQAQVTNDVGYQGQVSVPIHDLSPDQEPMDVQSDAGLPLSSRQTDQPDYAAVEESHQRAEKGSLGRSANGKGNDQTSTTNPESGSTIIPQG